MVSVVIVTFHSATELRRTLPALLEELEESDELIVVDNSPDKETASAVAELAPRANLISSGGNIGFARACNLGAEQANGDVIVLLNPDAKPMPDWEAIRRPYLIPMGWEAWMALVLCDDGSRVNTWGNLVHFTGISWAGGHDTPTPDVIGPRSVQALSGACMAIRREVWNWHGGFAEQFFLYCEDTDLSLRIRSAGGQIGLEPAARVDHEYEFGGRIQKWRWLERNRWATVIRTYPNVVLITSLPAMLAAEFVILGLGIRDGWWRQKLASYTDLWRWMPRLVAERKAIQAATRIKPTEFAENLNAGLDSPFFGEIGRNPVVKNLLWIYWGLARRLIGRALHTQLNEPEQQAWPRP